MNFLDGLLIGLAGLRKHSLRAFLTVLGIVIGTILGRKPASPSQGGRKAGQPATKEELKEMRKEGQEAIKERTEDRQQAILQYAREKGKIANDEVESMFCVSNSTATRYLDDLEKEGKLEQVGETGRGVYYRLKP